VVGYLPGGPAAAAAGLAAAAKAVSAIIVVLRSVLFGSSDPRSSFVRFMLLTCVLTGRPPGDDDLPCLIGLCRRAIAWREDVRPAKMTSWIPISMLFCEVLDRSVLPLKLARWNGQRRTARQ
jgi:hypothetical protein